MAMQQKQQQKKRPRPRRATLLTRLAIVVGCLLVLSHFHLKPKAVVRNDVVKFQQQQDEGAETATNVTTSNEVNQVQPDAASAATDERIAVQTPTSTTERRIEKENNNKDDPTSKPSPAALYRDIRGGFAVDTTTTRTKKKNKRPWCIWHVGPPKTATTTIQQDLTEFTDNQFLTQDNYTYSGLCWREGRYCGRGKFLVTLTGRASKCIPKLQHAKQNLVQQSKNIEENDNGNNATTSYTRQELYHALYHEADCEDFTSLVDQLKVMHARGESIVVSDEQLAYYLPGYATIWNFLQEILGGDDDDDDEQDSSWNFGVLVGYRRWMDFAPSRKWQNNLNARATWQSWPGEKQGLKIQPLFPSLNGVTSYGRYTDWTLRQLQNCELPMRIFNMNAATPERSLRSILFCDVIPNMDASCHESLRLDSLGKEPLVGGAKSWECDMLAVAAKEAGLIQPNNIVGGGRVIVGKAACEFHKKQHDEAFPPICPTTVEMQAFLNISLGKERAIMPDLYQDPVFGEQHHRDKFWKAVDKNKYCTINTTAVLQQEKWKQFFSNLVNVQETMNQLQEAAVQG